MRTTFSNK